MEICAFASNWPCKSKIIARTLCVPWSMDKMRSRIGSWLLLESCWPRQMRTTLKSSASARTCEIDSVGDVLHPVDGLSVERLLNGDVGHRRGRGRTMPMPVVRRAPYDVACMDFDDRLTLALRPAASGGHDQRLAQRMGVPRGACARLEGDARTRNPRGRWRRAQRIDANAAGEITGRS